MCVPGERGHGRCFGLQVLLFLSTVVPVILALCDVNARQVHHVVLVTTMPSDAVRRTGSRQQQGSVRMRAISKYFSLTLTTYCHSGVHIHHVHRWHNKNTQGVAQAAPAPHVRRTTETQRVQEHQHGACTQPQDTASRTRTTHNRRTKHQEDKPARRT